MKNIVQPDILRRKIYTNLTHRRALHLIPDHNWEQMIQDLVLFSVKYRRRGH